jgi:hypothetical protein
MANGWFNESYRHTLAARGITTSSKSSPKSYYASREGLIAGLVSSRRSLIQQRAQGRIGGASTGQLLARSRLTRQATVQPLTPEQERVRQRLLLETQLAPDAERELRIARFAEAYAGSLGVDPEFLMMVPRTKKFTDEQQEKLIAAANAMAPDEALRVQRELQPLFAIAATKPAQEYVFDGDTMYLRETPVGFQLAMENVDRALEQRAKNGVVEKSTFNTPAMYASGDGTRQATINAYESERAKARSGAGGADGDGGDDPDDGLFFLKSRGELNRQVQVSYAVRRARAEALPKLRRAARMRGREERDAYERSRDASLSTASVARLLREEGLSWDAARAQAERIVAKRREERAMLRASGIGAKQEREMRTRILQRDADRLDAAVRAAEALRVKRVLARRGRSEQDVRAAQFVAKYGVPRSVRRAERQRDRSEAEERVADFAASMGRTQTIRGGRFVQVAPGVYAERRAGVGRRKVVRRRGRPGDAVRKQGNRPSVDEIRQRQIEEKLEAAGYEPDFVVVR